jgi:hypothetical protein
MRFFQVLDSSVFAQDCPRDPSLIQRYLIEVNRLPSGLREHNALHVTLPPWWRTGLLRLLEQPHKPAALQSAQGAA